MLWGTKQIPDFLKVVEGNYATKVLGFNEWVDDLDFFQICKIIFRPDQPGQANLDPQTAASLWKKDIQPLKKQGYLLVSPAPSAGVVWLQSFIAACTGCTVRIVSYHYVRHGFNKFFWARLIVSLRTFTTLMLTLWSITLPLSTIPLSWTSGWQNGPAMSVVTSRSCLAIDRIILWLL